MRLAVAAGRFDEVDELARSMSSRQLAELEAFERLEGYSLGDRGAWERAALTRAGSQPREFMRWVEQKLKSFKDFVAHNPHFYRKRQKKD